MKTDSRFCLALLASGNGTNAEAVMKHFENHPLIRVGMLLTNNPEAPALERARRFQVPTRVFTREQFRNGNEVLKWLSDGEVTHIVLAGFLWLVPAAIITAYPSKILNIHPSLLPNHGGKGMYGEKVHQAVKAAGDHKTGITIHLVNEHFDEGKVIFQASCDIHESDTPETIAHKVHELEYRHFPLVIEQWVLGK